MIKTKFCILMGSPRLHCNTAEVCKPFIEQLKTKGQEVEYITLADKNIHSCKACYACQNVSDGYGCVQKDDMYSIVDSIMAADCIILATPIYTWYCPTEMKLVLDRHYGLNKYYGRAATKSYLAGKKLAIIATHGYDRENACTPFVTGIKHFCDHSKIEYCGIYSVQDVDDLASMRTNEAIQGAKDFADSLCQ